MLGTNGHQPSLQKWHNSAHEEEPDPPARSPESTTRALSDRACVEPVVDQMLQVLGHAHLPHELDECNISEMREADTIEWPTLYLYRYMPVKAPM